MTKDEAIQQGERTYDGVGECEYGHAPHLKFVQNDNCTECHRLKNLRPAATAAPNLDVRKPGE